MILGLIDSNGNLVPKEQVLYIAGKDGHYEGYPLLVLSGVFNDTHPRGPTASQLASRSLRQTILEGILDYYVILDNRMPLIRGSIFHAGLETLKAVGVETMIEKRLSAEFRNRPVSGQIDLYFPEANRLEDWKTARSIPALVSSSHILQLAVYAWLLRYNAYKVDEAAINYCSWYSFNTRSEAKMPNGEIGKVIEHPYLACEQTFEEVIEEPWDILSDGFQNNYVPSTSYCFLQYCSRCPVKWACDVIDVQGQQIDPAHYTQKEFILEF